MIRSRLSWPGLSRHPARGHYAPIEMRVKPAHDVERMRPMDDLFVRLAPPAFMAWGFRRDGDPARRHRALWSNEALRFVRKPVDGVLRAWCSPTASRRRRVLVPAGFQPCRDRLVHQSRRRAQHDLRRRHHARGAAAHRARRGATVNYRGSKASSAHGRRATAWRRTCLIDGPVSKTVSPGAPGARELKALRRSRWSASLRMRFA